MQDTKTSITFLRHRAQRWLGCFSYHLHLLVVSRFFRKVISRKKLQQTNKISVSHTEIRTRISETSEAYALIAYRSWFKVCIGNFSRADTLSDPIIAWLDFFFPIWSPLCSRARVHISNWYFLLGRAPGFYPDRHCQGEPIFTPSNRLFEFFIRKQLDISSLYIYPESLCCGCILILLSAESEYLLIYLLT